MCNLSDLVEEKGIKTGRIAGIEEGRALMMITMIQKKCQKKKTLEETAAELEEKVADIADIYQLIQRYPHESDENILKRWRQAK